MEVMTLRRGIQTRVRLVSMLVVSALCQVSITISPQHDPRFSVLILKAKESALCLHDAIYSVRMLGRGVYPVYSMGVPPKIDNGSFSSATRNQS